MKPKYLLRPLFRDSTNMQLVIVDADLSPLLRHGEYEWVAVLHWLLPNGNKLDADAWLEENADVPFKPVSYYLMTLEASGWMFWPRASHLADESMAFQSAPPGVVRRRTFGTNAHMPADWLFIEEIVQGTMSEDEHGNPEYYTTRDFLMMLEGQGIERITEEEWKRTVEAATG